MFTIAAGGMFALLPVPVASIVIPVAAPVMETPDDALSVAMPASTGVEAFATPPETTPPPEKLRMICS